jgi:hypothetical protein
MGKFGQPRLLARTKARIAGPGSSSPDSGGTGLGPELATMPFTGWTRSPADATVTTNATQAIFTGAAANSQVSLVADTKDNTSYRVAFDIVSRSAGNIKVTIAGDTNLHNGTTATNFTVGSYVITVTTNSGVGAINNLIALICGGTATITIANLSVKEIINL